MAVDPNTGQSVINIPGFDQRYAQFVDPSQIGPLAAQQAQYGQQGQLGAALMQRGYVQNSGWGGAVAQALQAMMGMKMVKDSREEMAGINQKMLEAAQSAAQKQHDQGQIDLDKATEREIHKAVGTHAGEGDYDFSHMGDAAKAAGLKAGAESQANLPAQETLEKMRAQAARDAAAISANATKGRAYQVQDANGNTKMVALQPDGSFKEVYSTPSAGGGKLTPTQQELNKPDVSVLESLGKRIASANQLQSNLSNYVANYTGQDPKALQGKSASELADIMEKSGTSYSKMLPIGNRGLDAIANDIAINAAGTKRETPTEDIIKAEQNNTVSRYKTAKENADIIRNHANDVQELLEQQKKLTAQISARQAPNTGAVPQATPGPTNPAPATQGKKVVRTGTAPDGTRVAQYDDGTIGPAQ